MRRLVVWMVMGLVCGLFGLIGLGVGVAVAAATDGPGWWAVFAAGCASVAAQAGVTMLMGDDHG